MKSVSVSEQQATIRHLLQSIRERDELRERLEADHRQQTAALRDLFAAREQELSRTLLRQQDTLEADYQRRLFELRETRQAEAKLVAEEAEEKITVARAHHKSAYSDAEYDWFLAKQRLQKEFEADQLAIREQYKNVKARLKVHGQRFRELVEAAKAAVLRHRCQLKFQGGDLLEEPDEADHLAKHLQVSGQVQELIARFRRTFWVRFSEERWALIVFLLAAVLLVYPLYLVVTEFVLAGIISLALATATASAAWALGRSVATRTAFQFRESLINAIVCGKQELLAAQAQNKKRRDDQLRRLREQTEVRLQEVDEEWESEAAGLKERRQHRETELRNWAAKQNRALTELQTRQEEVLAKQFVPQIEAVQAQMTTAKQELTRDEDREMSRLHAEYEAGVAAAAQSWRDRFHEAMAEAAAMQQRCAPSRLDYQNLDLATWKPPTSACDAVSLGTLPIDLAAIPGGIPTDRRFRLQSSHFTFPLALDLLHAPSLLIESDDGGAALASNLLRTAMLRLLTALPAGKLRFTIVDPVELGQNFSAFMHLADHDEQLVNHRIWTETPQINARLADLTKHMENVIQTYLRNEFPSIQDYNHHAGEVAEAFRVLVVANFPCGFSEEAAQRLRSIVTSGPRCGVYTLISVDTKQSLPRNFDLAELREHSNVFLADAEAIRCGEPLLRDFPVRVDGLPDERTTNALLHAIGQQAKDASRVEVPFSAVSPEPQDWWQADSRSEISIALGRAGATKLQSLHLGQGTSQHVLISGKTGSGKSTLMHTLITNLALKYSPDQVQFYLIDFKKGVEFKAYADLQLPHARVVAIESEREFGQSVLQRLDLELRRRGDLFRRARVQSLAGYRDVRPDEPLPRILLVIDEFQEFFVKEDRIAQEASLLLDRLVRQGRAFGIHVLLGSQTLAGAYSLARATIGQMAVRIALQCSASDAHLILSDDNDAARLLRRPGEAIYNDANGLIEGNHPFQVVWLSDVERESLLRELAVQQRDGLRPLDPPIVFEGNVSAQVDCNEPLIKAWEASAPQDIPRAPRAWMGEPIAIKEAPAAVFHRRGGGNLVIVGQQEEAALGIMASGLLSLAAFSPQSTPQQTRFVVLDGARPESSEAGYWPRFAETTNLDVEIVKPRQGGEAVAQCHQELQDRIASEDDDRAALFLFIYNLARFRDLQKSDDDFGLGGFGDSKEVSTAEQLATILREGPLRGVHTVMWSDTYTNLLRWLDRQSLRDIESRVLFQMSATDSSNLMDSSAAAHLGPHRAIFYSEDQGVAERFRPYGLPDDEFLLRIRSWHRSPQRNASTTG